MGLFKRHKTRLERSIFEGFTDWHSHILPGVDDGVQTMDDALEILAEYENLGVEQIWLTPHIMEDYPNSTSMLLNRFEELKQAYTGDITLCLASENMLDHLFEQRLEADDLLTFNDNWLLVETSYFNPPFAMTDILERIKQKGYIPVLAHPERYLYMSKDDYRRLKRMRVLFQMNLPSVVGAYGKEVRKRAEWLKSQGFYDLQGTDVHRKSILDYIENMD